MTKRHVLVGLAVAAVAVLFVWMEWYTWPTSKSEPEVKLTAEQQYEIEAAQHRLDTCSRYVHTTGGSAEARSELERAKAELNGLRRGLEKKSVGWVDHYIHSAYRIARRPAVAGELYTQIDQLSDYLTNTAPRPADKTRVWKHLAQARVYADHYAASGADALPVLVREEVAFVRSLVSGTKPESTSRLVKMFDELCDVEEKYLEQEKEQFRIFCHTKQTRRYFDAACNSLKHRSNWRLLELVEAELAYIKRIAADPSASAVAKDDKDFAPAWLKLVDELSAQIVTVRKELDGNESAVEKLKSVRETFDWSVNRMSKGESGYGSETWVLQSLQDSARNIRKLMEAKGVQKLEEPYDAEFQTWLKQYLKENPESWIIGRKVEIYLIPAAMVGHPESTHVIKGREHCYLRTHYNGRSVLAVLPK